MPSNNKWFKQARFGMFIHTGPFSLYGHGEQVLFRENLDQKIYEDKAARWNPKRFDAYELAACAKQAGMKYAILTSRHHDGYCLWNSKLTNYTSMKLTAKRDIVAEFVIACRKVGLKVGLYYSLADWRIPAYWAGPNMDANGWKEFIKYIHGQVRELLTNYGRIDIMWFDGAWPHSARDWQNAKLVKKIRKLQPGILINNRLGAEISGSSGIGLSNKYGDFGTPEHEIVADPDRLWESCQTSTWRLWGYSKGERWRPADLLLDMLVQSASQGGNLLINVGPKPDGSLPNQFVTRMKQIGEWMEIHSEAIYGSEPGDVCDFVTYGWQTHRGKILYLIIRFWDGRKTLHLAGLKTKVKSATLLTTGQKLDVLQENDHLYLSPLPKKTPTKLFPVIKLVCNNRPEPADWAKDRLWNGDASRMLPWAQKRGDGFMYKKK
jgi:alpha-L-fucosidase